MRDRALGATLFGTAAATLWLASWLFFDGELLSFGAASSIPAALAVGALAAPRLASDAIRTGELSRGCGAGVLITLATYLLSAVLIALYMSLPLNNPTLSSLVGNVGFVFAFSAMTGLLFLLPALALGAVAGWMFYAQKVHAPIDRAS
jgi:hypothetical protein